MKIKQIVTPQIVRWFAAGVFFAVLGVGIIKVMAGILGWPYWLATICSGELGMLMRFFVVDLWVFKHGHPTWKKLGKYQLSNSFSFVVWWCAANALKAFGVNYLLAPIVATFFSLGFSLLSDFRWIWRNKSVKPVERK